MNSVTFLAKAISKLVNQLLNLDNKTTILQEKIVHMEEVKQITIPVGYGTAAILKKKADIVYVKIESNQTEKRADGTTELLETVPNDFRPKVEEMITCSFYIYKNIYQADLLLKFYPNGQIVSISRNLNLAPVTIVANASWIAESSA